MSLIAGGKKSDTGLPLYAPAPIGYSDTDHSRWHGHLYAVPAATTVGFDFKLLEEVRLYGGYYWVQGSHLQDKMSFQVVDLDNVLGGGPGLVVNEYITEIPVPPWDHEKDLVSPTAALIPAGLYLRVIYINTGSTDVSLGIVYKWFLQES